MGIAEAVGKPYNSGSTIAVWNGLGGSMYPQQHDPGVGFVLRVHSTGWRSVEAKQTSQVAQIEPESSHGLLQQIRLIQVQRQQAGVAVWWYMYWATRSRMDSALLSVADWVPSPSFPIHPTQSTISV